MNTLTKPALPSSGPRRWRLTYHLIIVLTVKVVLLALLWHVFIKPNKVEVDIGAMSSSIAGPSFTHSNHTTRITIPTSPGDNK